MCICSPSLFAQSTLKWEDQGLTDENAVASGTQFTIDGIDVTVNWSTTTDGGSFVAFGGNDFVSYESGTNGNHTGFLNLGFDNDDDDPDDYITLSIVFSEAVKGLNFTVLDVDADSDWDDGVEVFYNTTNTKTNSAFYIEGAGVFADNESYMDGWEGSSSETQGTTDSEGNLVFDFGDNAVDSIVIKYFSTDDAPNNPDGQEIGLADLEWKKDDFSCFADLLSSSSYSRSDGDLDWTTDSWTETNDDNSPGGGDIIINTDAIRIDHDDSSPPSIERAVNLEGATEAFLRFDYFEDSDLEASDIIDVEVYNGSSWTTVLTISDEVGVASSGLIDISSYANAGTKIRFSVRDNSSYTGSSEYLFFDNIRVYVNLDPNVNSFYLEAECAQVGANWMVGISSSASRSKYLTIQPGNNSLATAPTGEKDRFRLEVTVDTAGTYSIYGRIIAPNGGDDSFWVRVNEGTWYRWNGLSVNSAWAWIRVYDSDNSDTPVDFSFTAGVNTIDFAYREDGAWIDKIFITNSTTTPSGTGGSDPSCLGSTCYAVSDNTDELVTFDRYTAGNQTVIGSTTGASDIEALTITLEADTVFAMNNANFGWLNLTSGAFTSIGNVGTGTGGQGTVTMGDVDGLTLDSRTGIYYGAERQNDGSPVDLLFAFDHRTGAIIPDFFGANVDYIEVRTDLLPTALYDIDDIAMSTDGVMFGVTNSSGSNDRLVTIDLTTGNVTDKGRINDGGTNVSDIESLSFDNDGVLYFISSSNDNLYSLDTSNASATLIGNISIGGDYEGIECLTDGVSTISGVVFFDRDGSSSYNAGDTTRAGFTVNLYYDSNDNDQFDAGETLLQQYTVAADGQYAFSVGTVGNYVLTLDTQPYSFTTGTYEEADFVVLSNSDDNNDFGLAGRLITTNLFIPYKMTNK